MAVSAMPAKLDGLKLPSLTSPHSEEYHQGRTGKLKTPPEEVCGDGASIEDCGEDVEEVNGQGEIWDQL